MENELNNKELEVTADAEAGDSAVIPQVSEIPEAIGMPEIPEIKIPEIPEIPESPEIPEVTETPETQEVKEELEVPEAPQLPTETMDDFKDEIEASFKRVAVGDMLTGTVIGISDTEVSLDLKYYAQAIISKENLSNDPEFNMKEEIKIGDEITGTVIKTDDGEGNIVLSKKEANDILAWEKLTAMMEERTVINGKISGIVNSGVIVYVEGIRGFIPASKLDIGYVEDLNEWLGKSVELTIINVDRDSNKLVLSAKEIALQKAAVERNKEIAKCEVGAVMEGTVDSIKDYGAFISLENGLSGLLHVSQIVEKRIKTPAAVLKVGQKVTVKIISIKDNKISLSMRALIEAEDAELNAEFEEYQSDSGQVSTGLGSLLAGFKFDK